MKFYALAYDKENNTRIIANLPEESRIDALNAAIDYCKQIGFVFKELRPVKGTERQNGTLTKTIENKRGRKIWF